MREEIKNKVKVVLGCIVVFCILFQLTGCQKPVNWPEIPVHLPQQIGIGSTGIIQITFYNKPAKLQDIKQVICLIQEQIQLNKDRDLVLVDVFEFPYGDEEVQTLASALYNIIRAQLINNKIPLEGTGLEYSRFVQEVLNEVCNRLGGNK